MPPRIPLLQCLKAPATPISNDRPWLLPQSALRSASTATKRKRHRDPFAIAQARAKKAANLSRQEVLKKERTAALGDPVRGQETPFLRSLDHAPITVPAATRRPGDETPTHPPMLNFLLQDGEVQTGVERSVRMTVVPEINMKQTLTQDFLAGHAGLEQRRAEQQKVVEAERATAQEAIRRIASLSLGNSKDMLRANMARCIDAFGRHNTDGTLPPKPAAADQGRRPGQVPAMPRIGVDTGSSEVQIAILTAKIRSLANFLETRGRTDKMNKRNLRLLVHRRQKLLRYLQRKERGGPRFQNVVETLGLTEGTWKGEISL